MHKKQQPNRSPKPQQQTAWQCQTCTFKNHPKIQCCEMCSTQKQKKQDKDSKIDIEKTHKKNGFCCHSCQFQLEVLKSLCPNCGEILIPEEDEEETKRKRVGDGKQGKQGKQGNLLKCRSCGQENDPVNQICVFCEENLDEEVPSKMIPSKRRPPRKPKYTHSRVSLTACRHCKMTLYGVNMEQHEQSCTHISGEQLEIRYLSIEKKYCPFCYEKFEASKYDTHEKTCPSRQQFYSEDSPTYQRVTKLQKDTMLYMHKKSQKLHWVAQQALLKRIISLGFKASDLENLHHYIVNYAPIIIHMHVNSHMQFFVKDTHYRNQFQTKKSSGSLSQTSRISWEDRMFDKMHHNATPFQRVKYGTINFTNDPRGVRACTSYGQSYFLLKSHVRNRCTVTDMDSSSPSATIATFQFSFHLFNKLPDAELRAAFEGSKANQVESNVIGAYKEIQIHGPVEFKKDIERVYVNKAELVDPKHLDMVKQFCKKNDLEYEIFQEPVPKFQPFGSGLFGGPAAGLSAPATGLFYSPPPLFGYSPPVSPFGFGMSSSTSIFSAPRKRPTTAHLFGGVRMSSYPAATGIIPLPPTEPEKQKQPEQGVDYI